MYLLKVLKNYKYARILPIGNIITIGKLTARRKSIPQARLEALQPNAAMRLNIRSTQQNMQLHA